MEALSNFDTKAITEKIVAWVLDHGVGVVLTFVVALVLRWVSKAIVSRVFSRWASSDDPEMKKRADTLSGMMNYIFGVVIYVTATIMILSEVGVDIAPVLTAAGIVGVAVGFGSQQLVQDVICGFFILLEDQVRVGDVIETAGHAGLVENVSLRTLRLRDLSGSVHYIRNGQVDVVTNMTKEFSFYVMDVGVAYRENVDEVIEVLEKVDAELRSDEAYAADILEPLEVLGLDKFDDSAVVIKARIKTKPIQQWKVGREFNRRMKAAFDRENIEIPFPHVTLYAGADKQGNAAAHPVALHQQLD